MSCPRPDLYQTGIYTPNAGVPIKVAKAPGGKMEVLEIAVQNQTPGVPSGPATWPPEFSCHVQFFEGAPAPGSLGVPISLQVLVQQAQLWSKPGVQAFDDIYMVVTEGGAQLAVEVRYR
jgi:hypothetical protein